MIGVECEAVDGWVTDPLFDPLRSVNKIILHIRTLEALH